MAGDRMALDRLVAVNLEGPLDALEDTLFKCAGRLAFPDLASGAKSGGITEPDGGNPYRKLLALIESAADNAQIPLKKAEINAITSDGDEIGQFVTDFIQQFQRLQKECLEADELLAQDNNLLTHLKHLSGLNIRFEQLFSARFLKVRMGRLPADSVQKLLYYQERLFWFFPFSREEGYIWGVYFTTNEYQVEVDDIFSALFFERVRVADGVRGTPMQALEAARKHFAEDTARTAKLREQLSRLYNESVPRFLRFYNEARSLCGQHDMRQYANVLSGRFYLTGFVPREALKALEGAVASVGGVALEPLARR